MTQRAHRALPEQAQHLLRGLAGALDFDEFKVFGGAALDVLREPQPESPDIDLAIPGGRGAAERCHRRLAASPEFGDPSPLIPYWVHLNRPVATFDVPWQSYVLDISFMDHSPEAHFNLETVVWHYPSMTYTDPHRVVEREHAELRLVTHVGDDNPILLLNRLLKLSAKYEMSLTEDCNVVRILRELLPCVARWHSADDFHGRQAHDRHLRHLRSAVHRAKRPAEFLRDCLYAGVLRARLPALAEALEGSPNLIDNLASRSDDPQSFWEYADEIVHRDAPEWRLYGK